MVVLTPEDARKYLERWQLSHEAEVAALRGTSMETKARQLATLMASRDLFCQDPTRDEEIVAIRARWAILRRALGG